MKKVVISEFMDEAALDAFGPDYTVVYDPALVDDDARLMAELIDAQAVIVRNRTQVRQSLLDGAPHLRCVGRLGVGLDNIDLDACKARGVSVHPASGANDQSVAEYVLTSAAILIRQAYGGFEAMIAGDWPRDALGQGGELGGRSLGLIGMGSIARETAARARGLGMQIHGVDPFVAADDPVWATTTRHEDIATLLAQSDVVSLHVPLTDGTRHLIGAEALGQMRPGAVLINAARGGVVDEDALAQALKADKITGAALDVFETEPLTAAAAQKFKGLTNLLLTPHVAGVTADSNARVSAVTVANVKAALG
jgi:(S)-sulfolactate dehydrogenase